MDGIPGSGALISSQQYWPYGAPRSGGITQTDKQYTGQKRENQDTVLGLYNYKARFYSTTVGRFTSADTLTSDGLNRFTYVRNNPATYNDPFGGCAVFSSGRSEDPLAPDTIANWLSSCQQGPSGDVRGAWCRPLECIKSVASKVRDALSAVNDMARSLPSSLAEQVLDWLDKGGWKDLNPAEKAWCVASVANLLACYRASRLKDEAIDLTSKLYAECPPECSDNSADAFRHCYLSGIMTIDLGVENASAIGWLHEIADPKQSMAAREMDLFNNAAGRWLGASLRDRGALAMGCRNAADQGVLHRLR